MNTIAKKLFALGSAVTLALSFLAPLTAHAAVHAVGTNVNYNGTIWMIMQGNCRAAYTSAGAFTSYGFNSWSDVVTASMEDLALPTCAQQFIPPQDGQIIVSDRGADINTAYFISGGQKRGFVSRAVYDGAGFPASRLFGSAAVRADVSWMTSGANIDSATAAHLPGALVHYVYNGNDTTFLVGATGLLGIPNLPTFQSWGFSFGNSVVANAADQAMAQAGIMATRQPGQLSPTAVVGCTVNCGPVGPLSVSLAGSNPASGTLVANQATADLAHFTFTGTGTMSSVTFQRIGVSSNSVFDSVYLYEGNVRLTDSASVNSNGLITFTNVGLSVNGSRTISVRADISSSASSGTVGVQMTSYTVTGSTTGSSVSVSGNLHNVVTGSGVLGTVNVGANTTPSTASVNAGTTQYTFWAAPISVATHSMWVKSLALRYIGSAPNDALANIKLYSDGVAINTSAGVNSNGYIVFDFGSNPFQLTTGSHTFDVRGDVVKGSSRTVSLTLQSKADFMVTDSQANINVGVTSPTSGSFSSNAGSTVTISTGSVTVNIDPTFQTFTNVTGGATNTVIGKFKLHAYGEDVKVESLQVTPDVAAGVAAGSSDLNSLNNVALYYNGAQIGSSTNWTTGTITFQLGSSMIVPANMDADLEVRADVVTSDNYNFTSGTVTVTVEGSGSMNNGQGMNSLDHTIDVPGADVATTGLTIATGTVSIAANPAYTTQTVNPNTANVKIGSFVLQNQSSSEGVRITNLKVDLDFTTIASTNVSNLRTSETSGAGSTPINPASGDASTDSVNNFPVNFTLAPGATSTVDIFADLGTATTGSIVVGLTPTAIGVSSNVNVSPSEATGQTINLASGTFANAGVVVSSTSAPQYVAAATLATDANKATYNFKATSGTATISELKFRVTTSSGASVSSVKVGAISAPVVSGVAYLTGLNIAVPNGGSGVNVDAFFSYGPVGTNGNTSGAEAFTELTYMKGTIGGSAFTTTGGQTTLSSNTVLTTTTSGTIAALLGTANITFASTAKLQPGMMIVFDHGTTDSVGIVQSITSSTVAVIYTVFLGTAALAGSENVYFFSVPQNAPYASSVNNCSMTLAVAGTTVATGATSGTDCMSIVGSKPTLGVVQASTQLANGLIKVGSVTVAADAKGDVAINALPLNFTSTGSVAATTATVVVKNAADQSTLTTTNSTLTFAGGASDDTTVTFTGGYTVTAGQTVTLDIYITVASVDADDALTMALFTSSAFLWTDVAGSGNSGAETGAILLNYPTATSTIDNQ